MKYPLPFVKPRLFSPGPTPVPLTSMLAGIEATPYHRTASFYKSFLNCRELLAPFFGNSAALPLILAASGTGAMEAALVNLTNAGDEVLCLVAGKFGERWQDIAEAYQCKVHTLNAAWGTAPAPQGVADALRQHPGVKAVFFQANETSTGVALPVRELAAAVRSVSSALIVVDAVSGLGAHEMQMDAWGVDAVVSASQKGFGTPPGLSFISLGQRCQISARPKFYFDLRKEIAGQDKGESAFTPATSLITCLAASLASMHKAGLATVFAYHAATAAAVRAAMTELGFRLLAPEHPSSAVTAAYLPAGITHGDLSALLRDSYGGTFAGGQGALKGKILRFAHLGLFDYFDVAAGVVALEQALTQLGSKHTLGRAVGVFMQRMQESGF